MHPPPTRIAAVLAVLTACLTTAASDDTALSHHHVTHDETTGEPHTAGIMLLDRTADGTGHASLTCLDHQPAPNLAVLVYEPRSAERLAEHTSEMLRVHVDAQPMWRLGPVAVADVPQTDDGRGTVAYGVTLRRGFLWELAAGERLIVQIGELPIVSLDVAAAKPDIVEFKAACDRIREPDAAATPVGRAGLPGPRSGDGRAIAVPPVVPRGEPRRRQPAEVPALVRQRRTPCRHRQRQPGGRSCTPLGTGRHKGGPYKTCPDRCGRPFDLPPDENPVRDLVGVLEEGRAMTIRWFQLPPVRFDLAGGRPAIAAFRARCEEMFDQTRSDAGEP